jgi:ferrous iron transport protein B
VFTLLYIPCVATIAAIKQESGSWKFPAGVVAVELAVAWSAAFLTYNAARAIF